VRAQSHEQSLVVNGRNRAVTLRVTVYVAIARSERARQIMPLLRSNDHTCSRVHAGRRVSANQLVSAVVFALKCRWICPIPHVSGERVMLPAVDPHQRVAGALITRAAFRFERNRGWTRTSEIILPVNTVLDVAAPEPQMGLCIPGNAA
jgi:hypothetical protein